MKKLFLLFVLLFAIVRNAVYCSEIQVYTMPLFISGSNTQNAWNFETASEIVTEEIINYISQMRGITTPRFQAVKIAHNKDSILSATANKWASTQILAADKFAQIEPSQDKIIIVASGVLDKKNKILEPWDVLKFDMDFNIDSKYEILTKIFLLDNKEGVLLWQKNYAYSVDAKRYSANKKYEFAYDEREKFRSYARNMIARDAVENLTVRLNPKSINYSSKVQKTEQNPEASGLKHSRSHSLPHVKITPPSQTMEERLLNDDSFEL